MARLYSARPNAVRPRSKVSRGVARVSAGRDGAATTSAPTSAAKTPRVIRVWRPSSA